MIKWKGCGVKGWWLYFEYYSDIFLELAGRAQNLSLDSRYPYLDMNPGPPEYEAELLPAPKLRSVIVIVRSESSDCPGDGVIRLVVLVTGFMFLLILILYSGSP
jgi:hypothetical protein